jgi:hypothetical protein
MRPARLNLDFYIGDNFDITIDFNAAMTGMLPSLQIRSQLDGSLILDCSDYFTSDDSTGLYVLDVPPSATEILPGRYNYDFQLTNADESVVKTYIYGEIAVWGNITQ